MKNQQDGFKNYALRFGLLLFVCAAQGADSSALAHEDWRPMGADLLAARTHQARELLGKAYDRSAANVAGRDIGAFVYERTHALLPEDSKPRSAQVARAILEESRRYGLDPVFTMSVIAHESKFKPNALGTHGEIGLMQIKPDTAAWVVRKGDLEALRGQKFRTTLKDPVVNIRIGVAYLAMLRKRFDSHGSYYLAAYNMGARKLIRAVRAGDKPRAYATHVMKAYLAFYGDYHARIAQSTGASL